MNHELVLSGPHPYFSTPEIFFGKCTCGKWESGKDFTECSIRNRHEEHKIAKEGPREAKAWENERWHRKL